MVHRIAGATVLALLALLPTQSCLAGEEEPIVWVADDRSLLGTRTVALYPTLPSTRDAEVSAAIRDATEVIRDALQGAGVSVIDMAEGQRSAQLGLQIELVHYESGSVGGRWVGMGGGAAITIVRAHVLDGPTGVQIGDVVVAQQVGSGGLFSIGASQHVLRAAARKTAEELATLFGVRLAPDEEAEQ